MTWLVQMLNRRDSQDSEVWRVKAESRALALSTAQGMDTGSRFVVGMAVPARGGTRSDKLIAKELRTYCVR
jgi:hypothetical protein